MVVAAPAAGTHRGSTCPGNRRAVEKGGQELGPGGV